MSPSITAFCRAPLAAAAGFMSIEYSSVSASPNAAPEIASIAAHAHTINPAFTFIPCLLLIFLIRSKHHGSEPDTPVSRLAIYLPPQTGTSFSHHLKTLRATEEALFQA